MDQHSSSATLVAERPPLLRRRRPTIHEHQAASLGLVRSSRRIRRLAKWILLLMAFSSLLLATAPWQQSVTGNGSVIAFAPRERQQPIEAPTEGRITDWNERITENAHVTKGEVICEIRDIDPQLLSRLQDQMSATRRSLEAAESHFAANERNLEAAKTMITAYQAQHLAYRNVMEQTVAAADDYVQLAEEKYKAEEKRLEECEAEVPQAKAQYERQKTLADEKISSVLKYQEAEFKYLAVKAKAEKAKFDVKAAEQEVEAKRRDRNAKEQKALADVEYATAMVQKAQSEMAKAEADLAKSDSEANKAQKELSEMETKLSRQRSQIVMAPMDGNVVWIVPNHGGSQIVKEGESLCVIVPDTNDRAVQIWIDGNDASLVEPGRDVRLQFEGWPAVQFAGWPSVAVGTFGGKVTSVDSVDDGYGNFRVLVIPDETDHPWPTGRYLRQGVRANGWVLLNQVPLWYEVWRRMNGFPAFGYKTSPEMGKEGKANDKEAVKKSK